MTQNAEGGAANSGSQASSAAARAPGTSRASFSESPPQIEAYTIPDSHSAPQSASSFTETKLKAVMEQLAEMASSDSRVAQMFYQAARPPAKKFGIASRSVSASSRSRQADELSDVEGFSAISGAASSAHQESAALGNTAAPSSESSATAASSQTSATPAQVAPPPIAPSAAGGFESRVHGGESLPSSGSSTLQYSDSSQGEGGTSGASAAASKAASVSSTASLTTRRAQTPTLVTRSPQTVLPKAAAFPKAPAGMPMAPPPLTAPNAHGYAAPRASTVWLEDFADETGARGYHDVSRNRSGGLIFRSTHKEGMSEFGVGWVGQSSYKSRAGHTYDTTKPPPQPCFNCRGNHWRKDCPRHRSS